jgi:hypothetical protein
MPKRLSPAEKDKNMRTWLNQMKINQVHKGVLVANKVFTMEQLHDSEAVIDNGYLYMNNKEYFVVTVDTLRNTVTVREMGNEQNS